MILLYILLVISFIGYHFTFFSYCAYIFNTNKYPLRSGIVSGAVNLSFWLIYIFYVSSSYEAIALLFYALILLIETRIIFKTSLIQMLFISVTFSINLFAKRLAILATLSLLSNNTIFYIVNDLKFSVIVSTICFAVSISTIGFARKMIPRNSLDTILSDNKNLAFLTTAFFIFFCTLFAFFLTLGVDAGSRLVFHYVVLGLTTISAFAVFIVFAYYLAELRIQTEIYKRLSKKNKEDLVEIKDLEEVAIKDTLTQLYTRDYANELVQKMIDEEDLFFVAFVDLDGLKMVNDNYGHEEGDFYIITVAEILKDYFKNDVLCRYGGDEIIVIGKCDTEKDITKKLIQSYKAVISIPKIYKKKYKTSISYGVAFRQVGEIITAAQLIEIADARMYELKRSYNKHRKVVSVKR